LFCALRFISSYAGLTRVSILFQGWIAGSSPAMTADFEAHLRLLPRLSNSSNSSVLFEHDFSENRFPPIGSQPEGMLFRIML
jgi:hypothetical protein